MMNRKDFLYLSALSVGGMMCGSRLSGNSNSQFQWYLPDESDEHVRTWMAFGAHPKVWGKFLYEEVQRNLALIANTISDYEPVSMLIRPEDREVALSLLSKKVELVEFPMNDLWMRDTAPVFVVNDKGQKAGIDFNFNGWGDKQEYYHDTQIAAFVNQQIKVPKKTTRLVLEGGCIEVDGHGTAICTESCIINRNRNPGWKKAEIEEELVNLLGLDKIIWLPGIKGKDITDGHTDFYARFSEPGVVIASMDTDKYSYDHRVTKRHFDILQKSTDSKGRKLDVIPLPCPLNIREKYETDDFAPGYVGFYLCNGAVIAQEFGDSKADRYAREVLEELYPDRDVIQLNLDGIAAGGGSIHCATMQEPVA